MKKRRHTCETLVSKAANVEWQIFHALSDSKGGFAAAIINHPYQNDIKGTLLASQGILRVLVGCVETPRILSPNADFPSFHSFSLSVPLSLRAYLILCIGLSP